MSRREKLIGLLASNSQISWSDFTSLMNLLGFELLKNNGSRRCFVHKEMKIKFFAHEPHPQNILKRYQQKEALNFLKENKIV
jgi:hypothetical protein